MSSDYNGVADMLELRFFDQPKAEGRPTPIARAAFALATFLMVTSATFVALTELAIGILEALASFRPSAAFGFVLVIYAPGLVLFLIAGVIAGLWASRRIYFRPSLPSLGRTIFWTSLVIVTLVIGAFGLLSLALPNDDRPLLTVGLYGTASDVNEAFAARLQSRFPAGSSENALVDELRAERFAIGKDRRSATFDSSGFPCRNTWYVSWQTNSGRLVAVSGTQPKMRICL